jgi:diguanylate cyclase (GGDEF)-like protein
VLAGATSADAIATAERLRQAIAAEPMHDLPLTMSFGVAATAAGEPFEFEALFAEADAALLSAKNAGRNRVCASGEPVSPRVARAA